MLDIPGGGLFGLIILALDIYAIVRIVQSQAPAGRKALWILLVVLLPVIGLILWYLMGRR